MFAKENKIYQDEEKTKHKKNRITKSKNIKA